MNKIEKGGNYISISKTKAPLKNKDCFKTMEYHCAYRGIRFIRSVHVTFDFHCLVLIH